MSLSSTCSVCKFKVHNNCHAIFCDICFHWSHLKCTKLTLQDYNSLSACDDPWFCPTCLSEILPFNHYSEDINFLFALHDFSNTNFNLDNLNINKYFNPFSDDSDTRALLNKPDIDPDVNIFSQNTEVFSSCAYYTTKQFNNSFTNYNQCFSTLHLNIRSLKKHYCGFLEFISSSECPFPAVIGLMETWLDDLSSDIYSLSGYTFLSKQRSRKKGGGVCLYIDSS